MNARQEVERAKRMWKVQEILLEATEPLPARVIQIRLNRKGIHYTDGIIETFLKELITPAQDNFARRIEGTPVRWAVSAEHDHRQQKQLAL